MKDILTSILEFFRNRHELLQRISLFVISAVIIVFILPTEGKFKFEYHKGTPWPHEDLFAPFDFAIQKSQEEIDSEMQQVRENTPPYFQLKQEVAGQQVQQFHESYNETTALPDEEKELKRRNRKQLLEYRKAGKKILQELYQTGIVRMGEVLEGRGADYEIMVLENNVAESRRFGDLYTVQSAYEYAQGQLAVLENDTLKSKMAKLLANSITQNIVYDEATTQKVLEEELNSISRSRGKVKEGEKIISRGDIVDAEKFRILESLRKEYEEQLGSSTKFYLIHLGHSVLVGLALLLLYFYLLWFKPQLMEDNLKVSFVLIMLLLMVVMANSVNKLDFLSVYIVPYCLLPVVIRTFFDTRVALYTHIITVLIIGYFVPNGFEFIFLQILAGIVAVLSFVNMQNRSQLFITAGFIFITYAAAYFGMAIVQEGDIKSINLMYFAWFAGSVTLTLFAYPLIYMLEKIFGFVSEATLLELSNTNTKLLRRLAQKAPGTFQHSLQVANLAENAAHEVGGNALLVRTGALYHDIGKMDAPMYFIENQVSDVNPHDELSFEESARIIIGHVIKGIEMAKKTNIPDSIIDFIRTHHGTTTVRYFYHSHLKNYPGEEVDKNKFTYPGPIPFSKETAILMMADSVEAASRSLKEYTPEKIDELVEKIIDYQMEEGQFVNADITFKDITGIKKLFKKMLKEIYHARIEYPNK